MRVALTHKFVLGSLLVGGAAVGVPHLLDAIGVHVAPWISVFVALGAASAIGFFLSQHLTRSFQSLRRATHRISSGDLSAAQVREGEPRFHDEIDDLVASVGAMAAGLRELVEHVQTTGERVSSAAHELGSSAQQVSSSHDETSSIVGELAQGVKEQQKLLDGAIQLIHEIASTIEQNAEHARDAFGFAAEATQKANAGADVTRLAIEKMRNGFEQVERAVNQVIRLEEKTRHVHQITGIITSVAHRTNLLSLNASIEAARAGEAGRGFSVVADEIRKLAESASQSTEEISKLIDEIQTQTGQVADEMRNSGQVINEGRDDVDTIARSLEQIRQAVSAASRLAEDIFENADSHTQNVKRMVGSMDEVAQVAGRNAQALDQVVSTSRDQLTSMNEMVASAHSMAGLADALRGVLRRFRTGGAVPREPA